MYNLNSFCYDFEIDDKDIVLNYEHIVKKYPGFFSSLDTIMYELQHQCWEYWIIELCTRFR